MIVCRSEPPRDSKPEAANFPSSHYEMSQNNELFHAPRSYPEPPKDMYYKVPEIRPQTNVPPKPIFPWEATARKPARIFLDELPEPEPEPQPEATSAEDPPHMDEMSVSMRSDQSAPPASSSSPPPSSDPWATFTLRNAWDDVASIDQYVRALKQAQARRGKVQVLQHTPESPEITMKRRESLILTDFPTEIERPSLPVTPAPIHRPSFWGEERNDEGELPTAHGVPDQADWVSLARCVAMLTLLCTPD